MEDGLYNNNFSQVFSGFLAKTGVTCYQLHRYTGLDEGYLSRLKSGEKQDPSFQTIAKITLAFAHYSRDFSVNHAEALLNSVGRSLRSRI